MTTDCFSQKVQVVTNESGIKKDEIGTLVHFLSVSLSSTAILALKTQALHWNVVGADFYSLHKFTEELYGDLYEAMDTLAERIRSLGHPAPASYAQYTKLSRIAEMSSPVSTRDHLKELMTDNQQICVLLREGVSIADSAKDYVTADMCTDRLTVHEKAIWMLQASLA